MLLVMSSSSSFGQEEKSVVAKRKRSTTTPTIIVPRANDILLGKNKNAFQHPGNQRYRHKIAMHLPRFKACIDRLDKIILVKKVAEDILDHGRVRFLTCEKEGWVEVPFSTVRNKVAHALRDARRQFQFPTMSPLKEEEQQQQRSSQWLLPKQQNLTTHSTAAHSSLVGTDEDDTVRKRAAAGVERRQNQDNHNFLVQQHLNLWNINKSNVDYDVTSRELAVKALGPLPHKPQRSTAQLLSDASTSPVNAPVVRRSRKKVIGLSTHDLLQAQSAAAASSSKEVADRKAAASSKEVAERNLVQNVLKEYTERKSHSSRSPTE